MTPKLLIACAVCLMPVTGMTDVLQIDPASIISAVSWHGSDNRKGKDRAILHYGGKHGDDVRLAIFSADRKHRYNLAAANPSIVWAGNLEEVPFLRVTKSGILEVHSSNYGIGRNKWEQVVTIGFDDGRFTVANYMYLSTDTGNPAAFLKCDINFLLGVAAVNQGDKERQTRNFEKGGVPLQAFANYPPPDVCLRE